MKGFVKDKFGQEYTMEIADTFDGSLWDGEEFVAHIAWELYTTEQMNLNDIYIRDDSDPLDGPISPGGRVKNYRNKGLGTELLKLAVNHARKRQLKFIYGSVTKDDISRTPFLLEWYKRHGFKECNPYKGCNPDAVTWVCMRLA